MAAFGSGPFKRIAEGPPNGIPRTVCRLTRTTIVAGHNHSFVHLLYSTYTITRMNVLGLRVFMLKPNSMRHSHWLLSIKMGGGFCFGLGKGPVLSACRNVDGHERLLPLLNSLTGNFRLPQHYLRPECASPSKGFRLFWWVGWGSQHCRQSSQCASLRFARLHNDSHEHFRCLWFPLERGWSLAIYIETHYSQARTRCWLSNC